MNTVYDYNNGDQYNESDQNNGQKGYDDHLYVVINGILTNQYNGLAFGDFFSMHCIYGNSKDVQCISQQQTRATLSFALVQPPITLGGLTLVPLEMCFQEQTILKVKLDVRLTMNKGFIQFSVMQKFATPDDL